MGPLIRVEIRKLLQEPAVLIATAFAALLPVFAYWQTAANVQFGVWPETLLAPHISLSYTLATLATLGPLLAIVVGAVSVGQEFGFRTWALLLTQGSSRSLIWSAKLMAVPALLLGWLLVGLLVGYAASLSASGKLALPEVDAVLSSQLATVFFAMSFWAIAGFSAALLLRSTAAGATATLLAAFLEAYIAPPALRQWLPVWNQSALNASVFAELPKEGMVAFFVQPGFPSAGLAVLTLVALTGWLLGISYLTLRRLVPS